MSEYWISQGRKMCTYCKCWIADNKASINFHEQGKNHKENVKKKLDELRKKGVADAKKKQKELSDMEKIEKAALQSLKSDITANPGMAGVYGIPESKIDDIKAAIPTINTSEAPRSKPKGKFTGKHAHKKTSANMKKQDEQLSTEANQNSTQDSENDYYDYASTSTHYLGDWYTAVNEEGYTYYWNTVTNETSWYAPDTDEDTSKEDGEHVSKTQPTSDQSSDQVTPEQSLEQAASEQHSDQTTVEEKLQDNDTTFSQSASTNLQAASVNSVQKMTNRKRVSAYGQWEVIKEEVLPDLQLPNDSSNYDISADDIPLPESDSSTSTQDNKKATEKRFKEKEITLKTTSDAPVAFKKRKFGANRQARRQNSDDT